MAFYLSHAHTFSLYLSINCITVSRYATEADNNGTWWRMKQVRGCWLLVVRRAILFILHYLPLSFSLHNFPGLRVPPPCVATTPVFTHHLSDCACLSVYVSCTALSSSTSTSCTTVKGDVLIRHLTSVPLRKYDTMNNFH